MSNPRYPHLSPRPVVTVGAIYTPREYAEQGYTAFEQRDYRDGTRVVLLADRQWKITRAIAYNVLKGTNRGSMARLIESSADISALVRMWRAAWRVLNV